MSELVNRPSGRAGHDRAALDLLLGSPEVAWLVARARRRVVAAGDEPLTGVVQLREPSGAQRSAAARIVGRPERAGSSLRVNLADVEAILRRGPWPSGLADAVVTLGGPVVDGAAAREQDAQAWKDARDVLPGALRERLGLGPWWESWCARGGLKRAARAEALRLAVPIAPSVGAGLVRELTAVLERLPAAGLPRAVLARDAVGDAHGLDATRPLGRLAVAVVAAAFLPDGAGHGHQVPRKAWAAAGVILSSLTSTAVCLGVAGATVDEGPSDQPWRGATARALEAMRAARMPVVLTLDQVRSGGVRPVPSGGVVYVCENPTVVEVVATRWAGLGAGAPTEPRVALVCTSGQPTLAVVELLRVLVSDGAPCCYHGDFDWAGLRIARYVGEQVPWLPWRFQASDYREGERSDRPSIRLSGSEASSPWDPELAVAMAERGLAIEEEAVADLLAADVVAALSGITVDTTDPWP